MPETVVTDVLKASQRVQSIWLLAAAAELEAGDARVLRRIKGKEVDVSAQTAIDYRHRAANLDLIIRSYEKLNAKAS